MLGCTEYFFLVKEDVQILHGGNFGSQLTFYKVLFADSCDGLYKLKCLKIQFSPWEIFYGMMFFIYFIYEGFKLVLWFGPYHKNVIDEAQIADGFVFNERIDVFLFTLGHEYVCVCRGAYCSHGTTFDLKVKFWVKNEIV